MFYLTHTQHNKRIHPYEVVIVQGYDRDLNDAISRIADYINTDEQPAVNGTTNNSELTVKQGSVLKGIVWR
jgi:hypothetical protein